MNLLDNSILFSYALNSFLDKLVFDCYILRNFAMCNLSLIKRRIQRVFNLKVGCDTIKHKNNENKINGISLLGDIVYFGMYKYS